MSRGSKCYKIKGCEQGEMGLGDTILYTGGQGGSSPVAISKLFGLMTFLCLGLYSLKKLLKTFLLDCFHKLDLSIFSVSNIKTNFKKYLIH